MSPLSEKLGKSRQAVVYFFVVYRAVRRGSLPAPSVSYVAREGTLGVPAPQAG